LTAVRRYWTKLADSGCLITGRPAQIAHCHGGSIVERMQEPKAKGKKLARLDWLVLPLCPEEHTMLDRDVATWERLRGPQAYWIDVLCKRYGVDLWMLAQVGRKTVKPAQRHGVAALALLSGSKP